jgi:hypothetical protein
MLAGSSANCSHPSRSCLRPTILQSPDRKLLIALFRWSRHSLSPQSLSLPDIDCYPIRSSGDFDRPTTEVREAREA